MGTLMAILVLGVLVFVHELGHFLVAKWCGVGVLEFAVGFGPVLARIQGAETTYTLRAIPLGGFVRMAGAEPGAGCVSDHESPKSNVSATSAIEGSQGELTKEQQAMVADQSRWFLSKSYVPRCLIVLAGPVANFLFAWVLGFLVFWQVGLPELGDGPVTIGSIQKGMPAETAGLKTGDKVVSVDGKTVMTFKELVDVVQRSEGRSLEFVVQRPKGAGSAELESLTIPVQPLSNASVELDVLEGRTPNKTFRIGVSPATLNVSYEKRGPLAAASAATAQVVALSSQTLRVLKGLVTGLLSPTKTIGGPIEIIKQTAQSANEGWMSVVGIMIFLNITLAVMNLLPIPVLDGGQLVLFTIEQLRGRPLSMRLQAAVTNLGLVILLSLMVFALGNDLMRIFSLGHR